MNCLESEFRRSVFNKLSSEYDRFDLEALKHYDYLTTEEQHKLDMTIRTMLVCLHFTFDF